MLLAVLLGLLAPALAQAASLSKTSAKTEPKKVVLSFSFSEGVDYEPVFHYKDNYVALKVKGLKFSSKQLKSSLSPKDDEQKACFRRVGYTQLKGEGEIRIALSKQRNPGDVQVSPEESVVRVEILLPSALIKAGKGGGADEGFIPRTQPTHDEGAEPAREEQGEPGPTSWPPETAGSAEDEASAEESAADEGMADSGAGDPGGFRSGGETEPEDSTAPAEDESAGADGGFMPDEGSAADETFPAEDEADLQPEMDTAEDEGVAHTGQPEAGGPGPVDSGPSYRQFDLSTVPVVQQEFVSIPLNEAVQRLIGDSGFNVVVGAGVDNTLVTLNFNQNQMSLKRALNALCMAYDLEYSVEDDVIIVRALQ